jgi:hypothetical protein
MTLNKVQACAALAVLGAITAALVYESRENARLSAAVARLEVPAGVPRAGAAAAAPTPSGVTPAPDPSRPAQGHLRPPASLSVPLAKGMKPSDTLGNQGRATAHAAFATQIWAARVGDVGLEASTLMLSAASRAKLEELGSRLPADYQAQYPTPEALMAFALAGSPHPVGGIQVLGEQTEGPNDVMLQTAWQHVDSDVVHQSDVQFHNADDGWKMVVPDSLVNRAVGYLSRQAPPPAADPVK